MTKEKLEIAILRKKLPQDELGKGWFLLSSCLPAIIFSIGSLAVLTTPFSSVSMLHKFIFLSVGIFVLLLAGIGWKWIGGFIAAVIPVAVVMWNFVLHEYQKRRVETFLDPEKDPLGAGWNIIQSTTTIGSGGWNGKGWLAGSQSQLNFLPESHTDFIIAVAAEEYGLVAVIIIIALFALIAIRSFMRLMAQDDIFVRLAGTGLTALFAMQAIINMGVAVRLFPAKGMTLPFVSYGGSSIVAAGIAMGMLLAFTRSTPTSGSALIEKG